MPGKKYTSKPDAKKERALKAWDYVAKLGTPTYIRYVNDPFRGISKWEYELENGQKGSIESSLLPA